MAPARLVPRDCLRRVLPVSGCYPLPWSPALLPFVIKHTTKPAGQRVSRWNIEQLALGAPLARTALGILASLTATHTAHHWWSTGRWLALIGLDIRSRGQAGTAWLAMCCHIGAGQTGLTMIRHRMLT